MKIKPIFNRNAYKGKIIEFNYICQETQQVKQKL